MSQLVINDLDFCQSELSERKKIRGRGVGWLAISVNVASLVVADLPGGGGAGYGVAVAIGLGSGAKASTGATVITLAGLLGATS